MINAVGLQGPGCRAWLRDDLPAPAATGRDASSPASGAAPSPTTGAPPSCSGRAPDGVVAVEVNLSCPNLEGRSGIFAHDPRPDRRGDRRHRRLWPAALGQAQPEHRPDRRGRRAPYAAPAPRLSRSSTRCSVWSSTRRHAAPALGNWRRRALRPSDPPGRRARGVRRPQGACPTSRSSASEVSRRLGCCRADARRRQRGTGRHGHVRRSACALARCSTSSSSVGADAGRHSADSPARSLAPR